MDKTELEQRFVKPYWEHIRKGQYILAMLNIVAYKQLKKLIREK